MSIVEQAAPVLTGRQAWALVWALAAALVAWLFFAIWPNWLDAILISKKAFINSIFNGVTLAGLYFLVASGFTLVFGLMRNVNLAHGSLYLLGAYIGYEVAQRTGIWLLGVGAGTVAMAVVGLLMQVFIFRRLEGDELRQTLVTLGISIVAADLMLAIWTGITYQIGIPSWLDGAVKLPIITTVRSNGTAVMMTYPFYRLVVLAVAIVIGVGLWLMINRTRVGMMIRAGVDDRSMLSASGINVHLVFAVVFAVGAGLAGFAGVVGGSALSIAPGEDVRYLLASLVVVIVGGMGSITGAAIGALLVGLAEQIGLVYLPTYGIVLTFIIMVVTLALRPQGIMGERVPSNAPILALDQPTNCRRIGALGTRSHRARSRAHPLSRHCLGILPDPDRRVFAHLGFAGAIDDAACRLWRHGLPGADHHRRRRRLHGRDLRHQQHEHLRLRLAVVGARAFRRAAGGDRLGDHRRDLGAHRGHLHHHDYAGDRRSLLLFRPAELRVAQRSFRLCRHSRAAFLGINWRHPLPSTISAFRCFGCLCGRALLLALDLRVARCRRSATMGVACGRSASTSPRTRSLPISTPASSPASRACFSCGSTAAYRPAPSAYSKPSTCWSSR